MRTLFLIFSLLPMFTSRMAGDVVSVPPGNSQKVIHAQKKDEGKGFWNGVGRGTAAVGKGMSKGVAGAAGATGKGVGWFFSELLRPVEALRSGLIDTFGVQEKTTKRR